MILDGECEPDQDLLPGEAEYEFSEYRCTSERNVRRWVAEQIWLIRRRGWSVRKLAYDPEFQELGTLAYYRIADAHGKDMGALEAR
jgi:ribosomal protein L37AE/L43A